MDGLLFRKAEIDRLQFPGEEGEIALRVAAEGVGFDKAVLYRLAKDGHLSARQVINGRGGRLGWVARQADVDALMNRIMRFDEVAVGALLEEAAGEGGHEGSRYRAHF